MHLYNIFYTCIYLLFLGVQHASLRCIHLQHSLSKVQHYTKKLREWSKVTEKKQEDAPVLPGCFDGIFRASWAMSHKQKWPSWLNFPIWIENGCEIVLGIIFWAGLGFFFGFLGWYGTICLLFATVWNLNLSFCMVFATFGHVHLPFRMGFPTCGHVHLPFCMGFLTCGHVHLPFCMVFATCWHVHIPFCMGCSTCEHVHPNIYRCGSLGLDKKRVGVIEGGC